jgi:hypothetical protein
MLCDGHELQNLQKDYIFTNLEGKKVVMWDLAHLEQKKKCLN